MKLQSDSIVVKIQGRVCSKNTTRSFVVYDTTEKEVYDFLFDHCCNVRRFVDVKPTSYQIKVGEQDMVTWYTEFGSLDAIVDELKSAIANKK